MLRLSRDQAAEHLGVSLNTVDRHIKAGLLEAEHVMVGLQRRVVVLVPENEEEGELPEGVTLASPNGTGPLPPGEQPVELEAALEAERQRVENLEGELEVERQRVAEQEKALAVTDERIKGLEELIDTLKEQVTMERARYSEIYQDVRPMLMPPRESQDSDEPPWWRFWSR